jgi:hypothetical protein
LSVLRDQPRDSTVEAVTNCRLLRLTQETCQELLDQHPAFRDEIEARIAQYDYAHTAQIPIDLYREILPADASVLSKVGDDQVDQDLTRMWAIPPRPEAAQPSSTEKAPPRARSGPLRRRRGSFRQAETADSQVPPRLADR